MKFMSVWENEEAIVNVEWEVEVERGAFGGSTLTQESSLANSKLTILIFWKEQESDGLGIYVQGV